MKRILFFIFFSFAVATTSHAAHIKGGFFTYKYLGPGSGTNSKYQITLTMYMLCTATSAQISNPINFSFFDAGTNQFIQNASVSVSNQYTLGKVKDEPCITGDQVRCYYLIVVYDLPSIELPSSPNGYIVSYQRCCRIPGIINITNSGNVGNTFAITIPGTAVLPGAQINSSPVFPINDTVVICHNSYFQYPFQASDADGDSLSYQFCDAYQGADQGNPAPVQSTNPPFLTVPYQSPYSGQQPMGGGVTINPVTGLISGTAPNDLGEYVLCVCVNEYRNGVLIASTRKELHVVVGDCEPLAPQLQPNDKTCDGFTRSFQNLNPNPLINTYYWDFGVLSLSNDTSNIAAPSYTYLDTGVYRVKLVVNRNQQCSDSATITIRVYPGFFPGFIYAGACINKPFQFTDTTRTNYGVVDTWSWNFGDNPTLADTSHIKNPQWTYSSPGPKTATLIVTNSKGCVDTAQVIVDVVDKPAIAIPFRDTLICVPDAIQLGATGTGVFSWTPPINIINANTATPTVNPTTDTWYHVQLDDNGCINTDSVHVRVVTGVTVRAGADTTICLTDPVQLSASGNALTYQWTPAATLNNAAIANPVATPTAALTVYTVRGSIGSCSNTDDIIVATVPYPLAAAGPDQTVCYNNPAQIHGAHNGTSFTWTPTSYLDNPNSLNPIASPPRTTTYILSSFDNRGCPKPGRDTIIVTVNPKVHAFAGHDTAVVVNQPLHFQATGGVTYLWSPAIGLTSTIISNPIGVYGSNIDSVKYKVVVRDNIGCADSAYVTVRVYQVLPTVFVPTAFTPNGDGLNETVYPITVGIRKLNYFNIYNRWGELVFTTTQNKVGWDGTLGGKPQGSAVFVWTVSAEDYQGKKITLKGLVTLIR